MNIANYPKVFEILNNHVKLVYQHWKGVKEYREDESRREIKDQLQVKGPVGLKQNPEQDINALNRLKDLRLGKNFISFKVGSTVVRLKGIQNAAANYEGAYPFEKFKVFEYKRASRDYWSTPCLGGYNPNTYALVVPRSKTVPEVLMWATAFAKGYSDED